MKPIPGGSVIERTGLPELSPSGTIVLVLPPTQHPSPLDVILYEHPLNERIRTLLRLEYLFDKANHHRAGETQWDARASLDSLFELADIAGRAELRTELIKELERHTAALTPLMQRPGVDTRVLEEVLTNLGMLTSKLSSESGHHFSAVKDHEMLGALRQRNAIPGGTCAFDLPGFHRWLQSSLPERNRHLDQWFAGLEPVRSATQTLMGLIRQSATATKETAAEGFYQAELDSERPFQLVQVRLPRAAPYFPEISGGRHRFTIRFLRQSDFAARPNQVDRDIVFELTRCII